MKEHEINGLDVLAAIERDDAWSDRLWLAWQYRASERLGGDELPDDAYDAYLAGQTAREYATATLARRS
jgi:hypothetical protein